MTSPAVPVRAALLEAFNVPLSLVELDAGELAPEELLVRVGASGVCHSDRNIFEGNLPVPLPQLLGHEVAGVVERVGPAVRDFAVGDHVVTCASGFCGTCEWCLRGLSHLCTDKRRTRPAGDPPRLTCRGEAVSQMAGIGGFAEAVVVSARAAVRVPDEIPLDRAAVLGCAVITGVGSVLNAARVRVGQTVAVIGCGGVGLNVVQGARLAGASRIIAVDRVAAKLSRALAFGATDTVDASAVDVVEAVRELTRGGVEHAFEVVGRPGTIEQAFAMLRVRGTATVVGVSRPDARVSVGALDLLGEKRLQGVQMGSSTFRLDVPMLASMYLDGRLMLDELVSRRIALEQVNEALAEIDDFTGARSVIVFS
jgi:S-(hydroxymethyl)glutathione dehydrogenase / alcohol dehydrogenase